MGWSGSSGESTSTETWTQKTSLSESLSSIGPLLPPASHASFDNIAERFYAQSAAFVAAKQCAPG